MRIGHQNRFMIINRHANSLYSLIAHGKYRATSLGRYTWRRLIVSDASLQRNCNREGFNARASAGYYKARIGIIANNENDCSSCNSRIAFGTGGSNDDSNTCGNEAIAAADNGDKHILQRHGSHAMWLTTPTTFIIIIIIIIIIILIDGFLCHSNKIWNQNY